MEKSQTLSVKIGGQAGQGIKSSGLTLAKLASRSGYRIHTYTEFPSLIRGGHNIIQVLISSEEINCPVTGTDLLIALNQDTLDRHAKGLSPGSGVIFDGDKKIDTSVISASDVSLYPVPLSRLAHAAGSSELLINTVAVSAAVTLLGGNIEILQDLIRQEYSDKTPEIIDANLTAVTSAADYVRQTFPDMVKNILTPRPDSPPHIVINGAEIIALGAIAGGLQFSAIYPMSPISGILASLAAHQEEFGYIYKQPEDEISAIGMSIGAGFAGARSLTATSGGGFALMSEALGLAAMTETPLVIVEGMRPGPATGLPTWSGQGDLQFVLHAHQGDFPRIVLAAGDAREAFELTRLALNLAEKYQTPVIVLVDKNILDDDWSLPVFDLSGYQIDRGSFTTQFDPDFARYLPRPDGISPRSIPGTGNFFIANSDEHDSSGLSTEQIADVTAQQTKRMAKLATCAASDMPAPQLFGPEKADIALVSWGSNKSSILSALADFPRVNFLHLTWMSPFPATAVRDILSGAGHIVSIEANFTGQLADLIAEKTGIMITDRLNKFDGRPFYPKEITTKLNHLIT